MLAKHDRSNKKTPIIILALVLILVFAVPGTFAYIFSVSDTAVNEFTPAKVSCSVEETFANGVKSDVSVKNTGNTDAFIRAFMIASWVDDNGNVLSSAPVEGTDFSVILGDSNWLNGSDGFYYYKKPIAPNSRTKNLFKTVTPITEAPEGYSLKIQILASAIQSSPEKAAEEAWGVNVTDSTLIPN